ncbi:MAG: flavodoxin family protein [Endomicrobiia bacterium]
MKGLILNFSPRKKGNSEYVAKEIYKNLQQRFDSLNLLNINDLKISKCGSCQDYCYKYGRCKIKDDMQILYKHFEEDDIYFFVTPVYFYHIPGYAKIMIDRCQPYWVKKYILKNLNLKKRKSFLICIGATKGKKLFYGIDLTIKYFFDIFNLNFEKKQNLYLRNIEFTTDIVKFKSRIKSYINGRIF